jgi:chemotaxis protein CheX
MLTLNREQIHKRLVQEICAATENVLSTMMALESHAGQASPDSGGPGPIGGVSAMVSVVGPWSGTGAVSCQGKMACRLAGAMLMSHYTEVNDEVLDAMGEVANMIVGNIKTNLEEELGRLALGVPTVTFGTNFSTRATVKHTWTLVPFTCEGSELFVQVLLLESPQFSRVRSTPARSLVEAGV